jgi:hypothetical protein
MESSYPRLADALPRLARDLRESLAREGEAELAEQVDMVRVYGLCACDEEGCLGVCLAPERERCVGGYRVVTPGAVITVGLCRERLDWIDDNEKVSPAGRDPERRREYERLRSQVPARRP